MNRLFLSFLMGLNILVCSSAFAHDASLHKGPMLVGELVSLDGDKAIVETDKGKTEVVLDSDTKFQNGTTKGVAADINSLKQGQHLTVMGHRLESGEFAATEVMIHEAK